MIKRLELIDFESHKHTIIDDFSDGLNLIVGDSNSGKSSLLRALKLAAYNMFDAGCVRIGAKSCTVRVDTDKGYVKVVRGPKVNEWEVCRNGEQPVKFEKVGKNVVPMAAEVIGFKLVTLGDVEFPVNVMSQLESHFMLSGVGDKNATGSMRAQIVDEISGLSGLEGVVKEVAADGIRLAREKNEIEERKKDIESQIVDDSVFEEEERVLSGAESNLSKYDALERKLDEVDSFRRRALSAIDSLERAKSLIDTLPDVSAVLPGLRDSFEALSDAHGMSVASSRMRRCSARLSDAKYEIGNLPEPGKAKALAERCEVLYSHLQKCDSLYRMAQSCHARIESAKSGLSSLPDLSVNLAGLELDARRLSAIDSVLQTLRRHSAMKSKLVRLQSLSLPDSEVASNEISIAEDSLSERGGMTTLYEKVLSIRRLIDKKSEDASALEAVFSKAQFDAEELARGVKFCPLTLKPISPHCMEDKP